MKIQFDRNHKGLQLRWYPYELEKFDSGAFKKETSKNGRNIEITFIYDGIQYIEYAVLKVKGKIVKINYGGKYSIENKKESDIYIGETTIHFTDVKRNVIEKILWADEINGNLKEPYEVDIQSSWPMLYSNEDSGETTNNREDKLEKEFYEGNPRASTHVYKERDPNLKKEKIKIFLQDHSAIFCEVCRFDFKEEYGEIGSGYIECHHIFPIHKLNKRTKITYSDVALLCSNCHRMIHRYITKNKASIEISEFKKAIDWERNVRLGPES